MSNQIQDFKTAFNGGTRPNRFTVQTDGIITGTTHLLIKAASMPVETVGIMQLPYRGRVAKIPGDRVYAEWTFTVLDDTGGNDIRKSMREWHNKFNDHVSNTVDPTILDGSSGDFKQWSVTQLDMTGAPMRTVCLVNCWPVEVGAVELSYDTADTATEFSVTLAYDWLTDECASGASKQNDTGLDDLAGDLLKKAGDWLKSWD